MTSGTSDHVPSGSMVLLLGPADAPANQEACHDLLAPPEDEPENVVFVSFGKTPDECIEGWKRRTGRTPSQAGVISVDDIMRSAEAATHTGFTRYLTRTQLRVGTANPDDLADLGMMISEYLELCGVNKPRKESHQVVLCFHTLTALMQWNDLDETFQFLHILTGMLKTLGAIGHFHLDPEAVDKTTVATVRSLFDVVRYVPEVSDAG